MDERYLINGLQSRNKIIFDFVFHYYYSGLCAYAERFVHDAGKAEDIVQDMFVTLWLKSKTIQINTSLKNYLFASVKNRSLDFIRREKVKAKKLDHVSTNLKSSENFAQYWFAESELNEIIEASLSKLPPRCREIIEMSRFEGLKNQEIAEKLNLSKRTVEFQISKALKQLRNDLKDYLPLFMLMYMLQ